MYERLGRWCFQNRWLVVAAWLIGLFGTNIAGAVVGPSFDGEFTIPASESADGFSTLEEHFVGFGSAFGGTIVFQAEEGIDDPEVQRAMEELFAEVDQVEHDLLSVDDAGADLDDVSVVSPYSPFGAQQVSEDRTIAFAQINLGTHIDQTEAGIIGEDINEALPSLEGVRIEVGGAALGTFEPPESELIGLAFAVVVLIVSFGSVLAMGLPIGVAVAGVATGGSDSSRSDRTSSIPDFAPLIGADDRPRRRASTTPCSSSRATARAAPDSDGRPRTRRSGAMDTAGRAVVFAGLTVVVSLLGMLLIGLAFISGLGIAAALTVAVTMLASITLLPALLGFAQRAGRGHEVARLIAAGFGAWPCSGWESANHGGCSRSHFLDRDPAGQLCHRPADEPRVPPPARKPLRRRLAYRWSRTDPGAAMGLAGHRRRLLLIVSAPGAQPSPRVSPTRATTPRRQRPAKPTT